MKKNIGRIDRIARIFIGMLIILIGAYYKSIWGILGMVPIITSQIGVCPLYSLFHFSTISKPKPGKTSQPSH
ncbi:MAG TPA: DUF2892 domain-containing protein [Bacteroidia bacterium]|jgi:hypothetical protein|nr:DUF2892 domain-containing protein [Bacteroidia bacterium]